MNQTNFVVCNLPAAKIDARCDPIDCEDKQTIFPTKPDCLSWEHMECLFQIWITRQQCADGGVQAKDCKADGKYIQSLKFTKQQGQKTGSHPQSRCVDKITFVCRQITYQINKYVPGMARMQNGFFGRSVKVKIVGICEKKDTVSLPENLPLPPPEL